MQLPNRRHEIALGAQVRLAQEKLDPVLPAASVPGVQAAFFLELAARCLQTTPSRRSYFDRVPLQITKE